MNYNYEKIEDVIKLLGEPIMRFKPTGDFSLKEKKFYVPYECAIFKTDHVSEIIVYCNRGDNEWYCNCPMGSRFVIRELLKGLEGKGKQEVAKA